MGIVIHMGFSIYDVVNMLVEVSGPRLAQRLRRPYAASYNESPVFDVLIMELHITEFPPYSCHLYDLRFKYVFSLGTCSQTPLFYMFSPY